MKESKLLKSVVAAVVVFALGAPAIASADSQSGLEGTAIKVSFADLNLQKAEGAEALYRRLQNAAKQACGVRSLKVEGSVSNIAATRSCYRAALTASVKKVDNENVSKIHAG